MADEATPTPETTNPNRSQRRPRGDRNDQRQQMQVAYPPMMMPSPIVQHYHNYAVPNDGHDTHGTPSYWWLPSGRTITNVLLLGVVLALVAMASGYLPGMNITIPALNPTTTQVAPTPVPAPTPHKAGGTGPSLAEQIKQLSEKVDKVQGDVDKMKPAAPPPANPPSPVGAPAPTP